MAISFSCPICAEEYRLKDELAGKRFRCKLCGEKISAPQPRPTDTSERKGIVKTASRSATEPPPLPFAIAHEHSADSVNWFDPSVTYGWMVVSLIVVGIWVLCFVTATTDTTLRPLMAEVLKLTGMILAMLGWIGALINGSREHWGYVLLNAVVPIYHIVYTMFRGIRIPTFLACELLAIASLFLWVSLNVFHAMQEDAKRISGMKQQQVIPQPVGQPAFGVPQGNKFEVPGEPSGPNRLADGKPLLAQQPATDRVMMPPIGQSRDQSGRLPADNLATAMDRHFERLEAKAKARAKRIGAQHHQLARMSLGFGHLTVEISPKAESPVVGLSEDWLRSVAMPISNLQQQLVPHGAVYVKEGETWRSARVTRVEKDLVNVHVLGQPADSELQVKLERLAMPIDWFDGDPFRVNKLGQPLESYPQSGEIALGKPSLIAKPSLGSLAPAESDFIEAETIPATAEMKLQPGDAVWHRRGSEDWYAGRLQVANSGNDVTIGYFDSLGFHTAKERMTNLRCLSPEKSQISPYLETVDQEGAEAIPDQEDPRLFGARSNSFIEKWTVRGDQTVLRIGQLVYYAVLDDQWLACRVIAIDRDKMVQIRRVGIPDDEPLVVFKVQLRAARMPQLLSALATEATQEPRPRALVLTKGLAHVLGREVSDSETISDGEVVLVHHGNVWTEGIVKQTSREGRVLCRVSDEDGETTIEVMRSNLLLARRAF